VKLRSDFLEVKGNTVRLVRLRCTFDEARPAGELTNQRDLRGVR